MVTVSGSTSSPTCEKRDRSLQMVWGTDHIYNVWGPKLHLKRLNDCIQTWSVGLLSVKSLTALIMLPAGCRRGRAEERQATAEHNR